MNRILLVEDDPAMAKGVQYAFADEGWQTDWVADGEYGLKKAQSGEYDVVVLDVRLPGRNGFDVCRETRRTSNVPIVMLTARDEEADKVLGLELGADDYVTKPFGVRELCARLRAVLRRTRADVTEHQEERCIRVRDLAIWPERRRVLRNDQEIHLTPAEFQILLALARRPGMVFTRALLLSELWGESAFHGNERVVNVHIRHLRTKLERDPSSPEYIVTVRNIGYRLDAGKK